ncbi:hypothetical protein Nepgr_001161 [Nepenthes gracilis]|uniref:Lysyl-tRNA synthetase n=1 Tax=Nepenthes gracilis TaxID=150966 RepID=A0AAD3P4T7_NEPGR|nr:hypothetical protein Nepgr_001161 [Nepenthes gracilis]
MKIVSIGTDAKGNINMEDSRKAAEANKDNLSALMVTYPSTHGIYEEGIDEICEIIHDSGGQVYRDGANVNAQVGLTSPGWIGADICHLNLHKTFCIPHGRGDPGMRLIGVKKHLVPFLPSHTVLLFLSFTWKLYCEKEKLHGDQFEQLKILVDIGNILGACGTVKRTDKGELSVCVSSFAILTKSLLPLPDKYHGLTEVAAVFWKRAKIVSEICKTVESLGFVEIETPVLQGAAGGAKARPFVTYHNSLGRELYLRIATELYLKRMLVADAGQSNDLRNWCPSAAPSFNQGQGCDGIKASRGDSAVATFGDLVHLTE